MSWIQENKFTASVLGATVVVAGALFYLGNSARSDAEELRQKSNAIVSETNSIKAKKPFPTLANQKLVEAEVAAFTKQAVDFQQTLLKFRPEKMPNITSADFSNSVSDHIKSLKQLYKKNGIALPDDGEVAFCMEEYKGRLAKSESTRLLNYERKALHWLFSELAKAKPTSLDNVYREKIEEEIATQPSSDKKGNAKSTRGKRGAVESVYRALPVEVTFTGSEHSLKQFLAELANSKDYFFVTRGIRIRNEKQESPNLKDAEFPKPKAAIGEFGDFGGLGDGGDSSSKGDPVLKQVSGSEKIKAHLKLDLILFKPADEVTFPNVKKAKKKKATVKPSTPNKQ